MTLVDSSGDDGDGEDGDDDDGDDDGGDGDDGDMRGALIRNVTCWTDIHSASVGWGLNELLSDEL